jgi:hypothetical protein
MRARIVIPLLLLIIAAPLFAQVCGNDETIGDCFERLNPSKFVASDAAANTARTNATADAMKNELAKTNTGVPTIDSSINTALRDFLSLFSATLTSSKLTENGNSLTLDWNAAVAPLSPGNVVKFQSVFNKAALDAALKTQLNGKSDFDSINNSLNDLDDVQLSATYAPSTLNFGRALETHRPLLMAVMKSAHELGPKPIRFAALLKLLQSVQDQPPFKDVDPLSVKFSDVPDSIRSQIEQLVAASAVQEKAAADFVQGRVNPFRMLLSNQPQLYASAIANIRRNLVGANGGSLKLTYERGGMSLKDFYATPGGSECTPAALSDPSVKADLGGMCATRFRSFATAASTRVGAAATGRWSIAAEYGRTNTNTITLPDDNISIRNPGSHKATGSFVYGAVLTRDAQNREGRFDVNISYENYSKDPNLKNRIIGSAVYSQKLTDTLTLPLGIVYASHPSDLPSNDKQISVHFGLVYKVTGGGK